MGFDKHHRGKYTTGVAKPVDASSTREEIGVGELLERLDAHPEVVTSPKIEELPLHDRLTPSNFEKLIARLAIPAHGSQVQAFRYGKSGSKQGGIDVICIDSAAKRCDYYEGKRVESVRKGDFTEWVERFIAGPHVTDARSFHLCTTYKVSDEPELVREWKQLAYSLHARGVEARLWDWSFLQDTLRWRHDIVSELFGDVVADGYCYRDEPRMDAPQHHPFPSQRCEVYENTAWLKNVSVACEVILPTARSLYAGASLSFSRRELSGITIAVSGEEIVHWMQWRAHAEASRQRPYATPLADEQGKYVYVGTSARLILREDEVQDLDWVFATAWAAFQSVSKPSLSPLQCSRFQKIHGSDAFGLISVEPGLWRAMLDFANEFDAGAGDTPWHMFDRAGGCLKPYSASGGQRFDRGYHAIMYAYNESGIRLPWETNVVIGWTPPSSIAGEPQPVSPRGAWSAQYAHDWLLSEFIPEVLRWYANHASRREMWWRSLVSGRSEQPTVTVDEVATSRAIGVPWQNVPTETLDRLTRCVEYLQMHAHSRRSDTPVPPHLARAVVEAVDRALSFAQMDYEDYLRASLQLAPHMSLREAVRQRIEVCTQSVNYFELDVLLRGLLEVLGKTSLPNSEIAQIGALLQPLLDRYHEDVLCDLVASK